MDIMTIISQLKSHDTNVAAFSRTSAWIPPWHKHDFSTAIFLGSRVTPGKHDQETESASEPHACVISSRTSNRLDPFFCLLTRVKMGSTVGAIEFVGRKTLWETVITAIDLQSGKSQTVCPTIDYLHLELLAPVAD